MFGSQAVYLPTSINIWCITVVIIAYSYYIYTVKILAKQVINKQWSRAGGSWISAHLGPWTNASQGSPGRHLHAGLYDLGISIKCLEGHQCYHVAPPRPNTVESGSRIVWHDRAEGGQRGSKTPSFTPAGLCVNRANGNCTVTLTLQVKSL